MGKHANREWQKLQLLVFGGNRLYMYGNHEWWNLPKSSFSSPKLQKAHFRRNRIVWSFRCGLVVVEARGHSSTACNVWAVTWFLLKLYGIRCSLLIRCSDPHRRCFFFVVLFACKLGRCDVGLQRIENINSNYVFFESTKNSILASDTRTTRQFHIKQVVGALFCLASYRLPSGSRVWAVFDEWYLTLSNYLQNP